MVWLDEWRTYIRTTLAGPGAQTLSASPTVVFRLPQTAAALPGNLTRLRHQRGLTVAELSRAAINRDGPVSRSTIRAIERGATNPTLSTVLALAQALEVSVEALVEEGGEEAR